MGWCSPGPDVVIKLVFPLKLKEAHFVGTTICMAFSSAEDQIGPERRCVGLELSCSLYFNCSKLNTAFGSRRPWNLIKAHLQVPAVDPPTSGCAWRFLEETHGLLRGLRLVPEFKCRFTHCGAERKALSAPLCSTEITAILG